jgi:hypothetical protein
MSSIAYITDKNMIEFHRIHGNSVMNFWRPTSSKRFTDFFEGDLLFFLAKGTEHGVNREKGIIGYGRYTEANMFSFRQMWNRFNSLNGYATPQEFKEAILRVSKSKSLAPLFHCLTLRDVVFFQAPVYLSELGISISSSVESYIYLDRDDPQTTAKILTQAIAVGIDAWTVTVSSHAPNATVFDDDLIRQTMRGILAEYAEGFDTHREQGRAMNILKQYHKNHPETEFADARKCELILFDDEGLRVILPWISNKSDMMRKSLYFIGKCATIIHQQIRVPEDKRRKISFDLLCDMALPQDTIDLLKRCGISTLFFDKENYDDAQQTEILLTDAQKRNDTNEN